ncbi:hypothetical protein [Nioella sp.]|uniref:hypothetical protein n=1 Tax=Nioella sp. TaxID=1912091 RepID=UPI00351562DE
MSLKPVLLSTTLAGLLASAAGATPVTLYDLFSLNRLANMGGQLLVSALRGVADLRYAHMDIRPLDGRMILTGLELSPYEQPDCLVTLDRAVITTAPLDQIAYGALDIDVMGAEMSEGCFSASERRDMAEAGITRFALDRGEIRLEYDYASAALTVDAQGVSEGLAEMRAHVAFDYFAVNFDAEEPVADLAYAEIELTDRGVWSALGAQIPPAMLSPDVLVPMLVGEVLPQWRDPSVPLPTPEPAPAPSDGKGDENPATPATPAPPPVNAPELDAAYDVIEAGVAAFLAFAESPGTLRLEFTPEAPVRLTEDHFEDFALFVADLAPALLTDADRPDTRLTREDGDLIAAWVAGGDVPFSDGDILRLSHALLSGVGVPRNPERAMELLTPLLEAGHAEALEMALETLDALDPAFAYRIAREAAAAGDRMAFAQLDRLEALVPMGDVIALQEETGDRPEFDGTEPARALRARAEAALTGLGAPRRYTVAYFYGLLALASGDMASASIVNELETMADRMEEEDAERWLGLLGQVNDHASEEWFAVQAPATLSPAPSDQ